MLIQYIRFSILVFLNQNPLIKAKRINQVDESSINSYILIKTFRIVLKAYHFLNFIVKGFPKPTHSSRKQGYNANVEIEGTLWLTCSPLRDRDYKHLKKLIK